jgi:hypothetical protein
VRDTADNATAGGALGSTGEWSLAQQKCQSRGSQVNSDTSHRYSLIMLVCMDQGNIIDPRKDANNPVRITISVKKCDTGHNLFRAFF